MEAKTFEINGKFATVQPRLIVFSRGNSKGRVDFKIIPQSGGAKHTYCEFGVDGDYLEDLENELLGRYPWTEKKNIIWYPAYNQFQHHDGHEQRMWRNNELAPSWENIEHCVFEKVKEFINV